MADDSASTTTTATKAKSSASKNGATPTGGDSYQLPVVGVRVPTRVVNAGFWGGLAGAALLGAIDPPLAVLVGAGVVIARHQTKK